jgi:hypothetical protein
MVLAAIAVCGVLGSSAIAGPLATDPNAYNDGTRTWSGTTTMLNPNNGLSADIDWCVYRPGTFPGTDYTYNTPWTVPHAEPAYNEFVYVYQMSVTGSIGVTNLAIQMLEGNKAHAIGRDSAMGISGGVSDDDAYFTWGGQTWNNLANWDFYGATGDGLGQGARSMALAFSSVNAPWMLQGRILDQGTTAYGDIASPSNLIPEPASLGLLVTGLVLAIRRRASK